MFLIAVVSIVNGMGKYMEHDLVGKIIALNSFELRSRPNINIGDVARERVRVAYNRPRDHGRRCAIPSSSRSAPGTLGDV